MKRVLTQGDFGMTSVLMRMFGYFAFWIILAGTAPKDLAAGLVAAIVAAVASHAILPSGDLAFKPLRLVQLFIRFLGESILAGIAVARIALSPAMPLRPSIISYRTNFPPGNRRCAFMTFASLLPGTLPVHSDSGYDIRVHCLGSDKPVAALLAKEETKLNSTFLEARPT